jgi:hypothetical protein
VRTAVPRQQIGDRLAAHQFAVLPPSTTTSGGRVGGITAITTGSVPPHGDSDGEARVFRNATERTLHRPAVLNRITAATTLLDATARPRGYRARWIPTGWFCSGTGLRAVSAVKGNASSGHHSPVLSNSGRRH